MGYFFQVLGDSGKYSAEEQATNDVAKTSSCKLHVLAMSIIGAFYYWCM